MSSQFHNRLVGVTILVTSVVIFLPSIIDGKKATYEDDFVATPIQPEIKKHTQNTVVSSPNSLPAVTKVDKGVPAVPAIENNDWEIQAVAEPVTITQATDSVDTKKTSTVSNKKKTVATASKVIAPEKAWTIQLGAFQNAKNINILLKKLHKAGFQAHTVPVEVIDGQLTRVFVGPDVSKKKLEKQLPQLKRLTKLQGKLLQFNAVHP